MTCSLAMPRSVTALVSRDSRVSRTFARLPRVWPEVGRQDLVGWLKILHQRGRGDTDASARLWDCQLAPDGM